MEITSILYYSALSGLSACAIGLIFTAPLRFLPSIYVCGFTARFIRDLCVSWDVSMSISTALAAIALVAAAFILLKEHEVSPVVLISGVMPLGVTVEIMRMITGLLRISSTTGDAQSKAAIVFISNFSIVFTTLLAIAFGLAAGISIMRLFRKIKT